jgi:hypothetical protein
MLLHDSLVRGTRKTAAASALQRLVEEKLFHQRLRVGTLLQQSINMPLNLKAASFAVVRVWGWNFVNFKNFENFDFWINFNFLKYKSDFQFHNPDSDSQWERSLTACLQCKRQQRRQSSFHHVVPLKLWLLLTTSRSFARFFLISIARHDNSCSTMDGLRGSAKREERQLHPTKFTFQLMHALHSALSFGARNGLNAARDTSTTRKGITSAVTNKIAIAR